MATGVRYTEDEAREAIAASQCYSEALRRLGMRAAGGNHATLKKYAERIWGIPVDHFDAHAARVRRPQRSLDEVLVDGSGYSRGLLKRRLYEAGLKARACELCGQGEEWRGRRMALILDHINGAADDNRLENLRIVCPNCAATLETHCGRNKRAPPRCAVCGREFRTTRVTQRFCCPSCANRSPAAIAGQVAQRRVERPPYEQLRAEIEATSFVAVGRKYGVSDNAIRKWLRAYERGGG